MEPALLPDSGADITYRPPRMRTAAQALVYFRQLDPDSALTESAIRRVMKSGAVPVVRLGRKTLVDLGVLEAYFLSMSSTQKAAKPPEKKKGELRPIALK